MREPIGKRLLRALAGLLLLLAAWVGVYSVSATGKEYPLTGVPARAGGVRGAYHVHTEASHDGRARIEEVARAARATGLQFVIVTDHNAEQLPPPAYVEGVLMIHGVELSTPAGHLVALGVPRGLTAEERKGDAIAAVHALGGRAFLAHPVQRRNPWRDWDAGMRADGLEIYSGDSFFREALGSPTRLACAVGSYFANPVHGMSVLARPSSEAGERSVELSAERPKVALCGLDAHGIPPHEAPFSTVAMYLPGRERLPAEAAAAAREVLEAIFAGQAVCAFDALGDPRGFEVVGADGGARVGDRLEVRLPPTGPARARVVAFGSGRAEGHAVVLDRPGAVQLEVQLLAPGCLRGEEWRPWLVPSPILVR